MSRYRRGTPAQADPPSESSLYTTDSDDYYSDEENNHRIRQAIRYLETEGGDDPDELYRERVDTINDLIVDRYFNEGYSYDPALYRRLRNMVREELTEFELADQFAGELSDGTDSEVEEIRGLYRSDSEEPEPEAGPSGTYVAPVRKATQGTTPEGTEKEAEEAIVRETQWLYGGPDNDKEVWASNFAPILPFGETFQFQEWESMKINYDLRESARKKKDKEDGVVRTNVPFDQAVAAVLERSGNLYDTGSRFKLPFNIQDSMRDRVREQLKGLNKAASLAEVIQEFNSNAREEGTKKDYTPRLFLERVLAPRRNSSGPTSGPSSGSGGVHVSGRGSGATGTTPAGTGAPGATGTTPAGSGAPGTTAAVSGTTANTAAAPGARVVTPPGLHRVLSDINTGPPAAKVRKLHHVHAGISTGPPAAATTATTGTKRKRARISTGPPAEPRGTKRKRGFALPKRKPLTWSIADDAENSPKTRTALRQALRHDNSHILEAWDEHHDELVDGRAREARKKRKIKTATSRLRTEKARLGLENSAARSGAGYETVERNTTRSGRKFRAGR